MENIAINIEGYTKEDINKIKNILDLNLLDCIIKNDELIILNTDRYELSEIFKELEI